MLVIDKNIFFREAAIRICGDLDIEKALYNSLDYLKNYLPVDKVFLQIYELGYTAMRTIASADLTSCEKLNMLTPLSAPAIIAMKQSNVLQIPEIFIQNDLENFPVTIEMLTSHKTTATSILVFTMKDTQKLIGSLVFIASGKELFNEAHSKLLQLLKDPFTIAVSNALRHMEITRLSAVLRDDNRYLFEELRSNVNDVIVGSKFGLSATMEKVQQVAPLESPVLITGETGTGKDVIAAAIHQSSSRRDKPFIPVNCGAIPEGLLDSELFGHEKGAFTGALSRKRGRFERAEKGTIFLDEIGELPLAAQVRLLRVLQNKEIERVGGTETVSLDIRVIAATNKDLQKMVKEKLFREDLYFRLNVFPISVPPLRNRVMDIPELIQYFILQKAKELKLPHVPELAPDAVTPLLAYKWPGNVRELQNIVERALIICRDKMLSFKDLLPNSIMSSEPLNYDSQDSLKMEDVMKNHILFVLRKSEGKIHGSGGAAEILDVNASTLRNRMKNLGIDFARYTKKG